MSQIIIKPEELEKEADNYEKVSKAIQDVKYPFSGIKTNISSIQKYLECIQKMQNAIAAFSDLSVKDAENLRKVKDDWMRLDSGM